MTQTLLSSWSSSLWTASWQGLLFVAAVWALCRVFRSLPSSTKAWLWWLAALKLLVGLVWVGIELPWLPAAEANPLAKLNHRLDLMAPKIVSQPAQTSTDGSVQSVSASAPAPAPEGTNWAILVLPGLWAVGVLCVAAGVANQGAKMHGLRRRATPAGTSKTGQIARELGAKMGLSRSPVVLASTEVSAPMVAGMMRPALLLPAGLENSLDENELRLCIAHELAHIRRRDLPLALVPTLMQVAFFFFPPAWLIRREWEMEREAACDAEALEVTSASPAAYGRLLMRIVTDDHHGALSPALGATASYHTLKKRITNMMHFAPTRRRMKAFATAIGLFALVLTVPWQVTPRAAAATPAVFDSNNVVVNGGFEDMGKSGPVGWMRGSLPPDANVPVTIAYNQIKDSDSPRVQATRHTGHGSVSFSKTLERFYPVALLAQPIPYDGQKRLKVSLWAKADGVRKFALAVIMDGAGDAKIEWGAYIGDSTSSTAVTHDWKQYTNEIDIPPDTTNITLALEMYGPGTVYVDDVSVSYDAASDAALSGGDPSTDIKDVPNEDLRADGDAMKRYFLIGAKPAQPANGYKLLLVLPGGDASADFNPFVRRIWQNALPEGYLTAELVAPKWSNDQFDSLVWPTRKEPWHGMKFATEDFIESVIKDVEKRYKIDTSHIYSLSWSSSGPAAYSASLNVDAIKGSFVAMSIFVPDQLPALSGAKNRLYYIYSSPDDRIVKFSYATQALTKLTRAGAKATLETYAGGHGWHGDVYGGIRKGIDWMEKGGG
ncbi:MAG TPA: M56 family metallopeptidase [Fimbriimonadaceae bacterium]|nr:M56 family metallopeptidase [Fimbriimonadaceae bacterium]